MKKITNRQFMQWMKVLHLLLISIWLGGVVCVSVLLAVAFFQWPEEQFMAVVPMLMMIYPKVLAPAAGLTILQGICYGIFTKWGFVKHTWLRFKWLLVVLIGLCTGAGMLDPLFALLERIPVVGFQGGFADGGMILLGSFLQVLLLVAMVVLSVFKLRKSN